jgi:D-alanyl-D-alanine carboxypeptidase
MGKLIIILNGVSGGKTKFIETAKANDYWVWNLNDRNVLSMLSYKVGWDGNRTKQYYEFIEEFEQLVDKYFNFEDWYLHNMISKFTKDDKANLLIIHNCKENMMSILKKEFANCFAIGVWDQIEPPSSADEEYFAIFDSHDENYSEKVLLVLKELSEEVKE